MGSYGSIILIVVMIIAFYFLIMRPQRRRQQQQAEMMNAIEAGSRVVTTTGIYATVVAVGDKQIVLETAPGNRVTMMKQAVGQVVRDDKEDASLAPYRAGGGVGPAPEQSGAGPDSVRPDEPTTASGMAGGAPIQEYAPGSVPDFTAPENQAPQAEEHETAPWPPYGSAEGGSSESSGSVLGDSSLGSQQERDEDRPEQEGTEHNTKGYDTDR